MSSCYPFELIDIPGVRNARDLGGYAGDGGRTIQKRRFLRTASMSELSAEAVDAVRREGVDCVVDLRSRFERSKSPDTLAEDGDIAYVHIPMLDYVQSNIADSGVSVFPSSMGEMYVGLLEQAKGEFFRLFSVFADDNYRTVLFHCTAGKDRTGLSAMLLLGFAGAERPVIVEDYIHSETLYPPPQVPGLPRYLFTSPPETIEAALDHLDSQYGGIRPYLAEIGVEGELASALRRKLFDPVV